MPIYMRGNYLFVNPGESHFVVASNFTNYLELGTRGTTSYYLEARIEAGAPLINATLNDPGGEQCIVRDNFPNTVKCNREMTPNGYRIYGSSGELLLGLHVEDGVCHILGKLYDTDGDVVAEQQGDDYLIHRGPAVLGRSGDARGIVID